MLCKVHEGTEKEETKHNMLNAKLQKPTFLKGSSKL